MKKHIYIDTEFIEGSQPKKFLGITYGQTKPLVDLISIAAVSEHTKTGRLQQYYAVSNEFNFDHAWNDVWIRENVLFNIFPSSVVKEKSYDEIKSAVKVYGKNNRTIATQIFLLAMEKKDYGDERSWDSSDIEFLLESKVDYEIVFWAYYASTDWVAFYQLWGKMIEAPSQYPMYVSCLKQKMDEHQLTADWKRATCPEPENEHNALADALWNYGLHQKIDEVLSVREMRRNQKDPSDNSYQLLGSGYNGTDKGVVTISRDSSLVLIEMSINSWGTFLKEGHFYVQVDYPHVIYKFTKGRLIPAHDRDNGRMPKSGIYYCIAEPINKKP